jgi:hypothetical protein
MTPLIQLWRPDLWRIFRSLHPPPNERKMDQLQQLSDEQGLGLDCSSAGALQTSLTHLRQVCHGI